MNAAVSAAWLSSWSSASWLQAHHCRKRTLLCLIVCALGYMLTMVVYEQAHHLERIIGGSGSSDDEYDGADGVPTDISKPLLWRSAITTGFLRLVDTLCNVHAPSVNTTCLNALVRFEAVAVEREQQQAKSSNNSSSNSNNDLQCSACLMTRRNRRLIVYHHTFWQIRDNTNDTMFNFRVLLLNIMSYLATQNTCCTRFMLWTLPRSFPHRLQRQINATLAPYLRRRIVQLRAFDLDELCTSRQQNSYKNNHNNDYDHDHDDENTPGTFRHTALCAQRARVRFDLADSSYTALSDLVRFMVLDAYGGIYTDGDVVYLRDMRRLWPVANFAYRWGFTGHVNTAVLGMNVRVNASARHLYAALLHGSGGGLASQFVAVLDSLLYSLLDFGAYGVRRFISYFHPYSVSEALVHLTKTTTTTTTTTEETTPFDAAALRIFSSALFDPAWLPNCVEGMRALPHHVCSFAEFCRGSVAASQSQQSTARSAMMFFGGAFTYHMHLKDCGNVVVNTSYFRLFENHYRAVLRLDNPDAADVAAVEMTKLQI